MVKLHFPVWRSKESTQIPQPRPEPSSLTLGCWRWWWQGPFSGNEPSFSRPIKKIKEDCFKGVHRETTKKQSLGSQYLWRVWHIVTDKLIFLANGTGFQYIYLLIYFHIRLLPSKVVYLEKFGEPQVWFAAYLVSGRKFVEKAMAPHSSTLAWKIPWTEEPGRLQSMGSLGVGHNRATSLSLFTFMHWRRKWQPTPVFLPGESQGRGAWWAAVHGVAQSRTRLK